MAKRKQPGGQWEWIDSYGGVPPTAAVLPHGLAGCLPKAATKWPAKIYFALCAACASDCVKLIVYEHPHRRRGHSEVFHQRRFVEQTVTEGKHFSGTATAFKAAKQESVGKFNIVGYVTETKQFINLDHGKGKGATEVAS